LTKSYHDLVALAPLDLCIPRGTLAGFVGPNGAGKTTTFRLLAGLLSPTAGRASILGHDVATQPEVAKHHLGIVFDDSGLYDHLTPREFLRFIGGAFGLDRAVIAERTPHLLDVLSLTDKQDTLCRELSLGMRKKLELAAALLHDPGVLLLDEPFSGIDPIDARVVKEVLRDRVDRGATVLLSSHVLETIEAMCDEVTVIDGGNLIAQGPVEGLRERVQAPPGSSLESVFLALVDPRRERAKLW
jgi:ABC-2 type transport system ATP-binding protein